MACVVLGLLLLLIDKYFAFFLLWTELSCLNSLQRTTLVKKGNTQEVVVTVGGGTYKTSGLVHGLPSLLSFSLSSLFTPGKKYALLIIVIMIIIVITKKRIKKTKKNHYRVQGSCETQNYHHHLYYIVCLI